MLLGLENFAPLRLCVRLFLPVLALWTSISAAPISQFDPPVRSLQWQVIETEHFKVYFTSGNERVAASIAVSAEQAYGPITDLYDYRPPGKTEIVVRDHGDIANGFAAYFQNRMEIWATALDYEFRSSHDWIRDVTTHEFTHIVQLGASKKAPAWLPQVYFQWFRLEPEQRTDVAEGLPNVLASYAVPTVTIPMWFAEGVAQHQSTGARYDWWDTHRDMILRVAVLSDSELSYRQMEGFYDHDGREAEMVYDHGFAFVRWLAAQYGDSALRDLTRTMMTWHTWSFDRALRKLTGKPGQQVYNEWTASTRDRYEAFVKNREAGPEGTKLESPAAPPSVEAGELPPAVTPGTRRLSPLASSSSASSVRNSPATRGVAGTVARTVARVACPRCRALSADNIRAGYYNAAPAWSPDGSLLAYVSNEGQDYHLPAIWVRKPGTDELTVAPESYRATSTVSWFPDGRTIVFSRAKRDPQNEWRYNDLVKVDLQTETVTELTEGWRATYPAVSPDGRTIVFVRNSNGTTNLWLVDGDGDNPRPLSRWTDGTQVYSPHWSPDGAKIAFSIARAGRRDIVLAALAGTSLLIERVIASAGEDRDPVFTPDGTKLVFASSLDSVSNLYEMDLETGDVSRITNVVGGVFYPDVAPDGRIAYTSYEARGYVIRILPADQPRTPVGAAFFRGDIPEHGTFATISAIGATPKSVDRRVPHLQAPALLPRIGRYADHWRVGAYAFTGDIWDDALLLGGYWVSPDNFDYDAFVTAELNHLAPWPLAFDAIRIVRHTNVDTTYNTLSFDGVNYALNSFTASIRPRMGSFDTDLHALYQRFDAEIDQTLSVQGAPVYAGYNYTYYHGVALGASVSSNAVKAFTTADIAPQGYRWTLRYNRWWNWFFEDFDAGSQFADEVYTPYYYNQLSLDGAYYLPMPWHGEHTLGLEGEAAALFEFDPDAWPGFADAKLDSFFYEGIGGIIGLRGYTYYQLQGSRTARGRLFYRLPLLRNIDWKLGPLYFDKVYLSAFAEAGRVWREAYNDPWVRGLKRDVGAELRADIFSFYGYPSRLALSYAYALDPRPGTDRTKFYLTLLFGYL